MEATQTHCVVTCLQDLVREALSFSKELVFRWRKLHIFGTVPAALTARPNRILVFRVAF